MSVVQIFRQILEVYEIVVAPAVSFCERGSVFFADCFACCIQADEFQPEIVVLKFAQRACNWVRFLNYSIVTSISSKKRERWLGT
jgi:hypothetical protein